MMIKKTLAAALLLGGASLAQAGLKAPPYPVFKSPEAINIACDEGLNAAKARLRALEARKSDAGWISALDRFAAANEDDANDIDFLQYVAVTKELRDAAQACSLRWTEFNSALLQNAKLYKALKAVPAKDGADRELKRTNLADFEAGGVTLAPAKQRRAKEIIDKLAELDQAFNKNIRDAGIQVRFTEAELAGVPQDVWREAPREADGRIVLGVSNPVYTSVLRTAESAEARERMWRAKTNEGGQANMDLLEQIGKLRHELGGLFGYDNYVDFKLRNRMAHDAKTVSKFLDDVKNAVDASDRADTEVLRQAKAKALGTDPATTEFRRWDAEYYAEAVRRERFQVDQEAFRPYFPSEQALAFVMRVIEKTMGVRYAKQEESAWAPGVSVYKVSDAASGQDIAKLYVDLYPREGKYGHAAVWGLRGGSTELQRMPVAALVVNLNDKGLSLDEMVVLLHEFGHSVHNNLSLTRHSLQAGTSVVRDFVEAPSQMLEEWVYDAKVLKLMTEVCASCKPVPDELLAKAVAARDFGKGMFYNRQRLQAAYDLALNGRDVPNPQQLWARMEGETPLGHVPGTMFPSRFTHLSSDGYGAGYYSYLWSLVLAMDMRTAFGADKLNPVVGMKYRNEVLAQGSQQPAIELVNKFLGRPWNSQAFFADLKR
ncbi:MAG: Zn-dependent oligopeptidase [Paucibacter sp.]|nr:Zn-dependent oligopeptidase [Roseateles sp.]